MTISGKIKNDLDKKAFEAMKSWKLFFKDDYSFFINQFIHNTHHQFMI